MAAHFFTTKSFNIMKITCYDGKSIELSEKFDAPAGSVGEFFAKEFLPEFNSGDVNKFSNGAKILFDRDENCRPLNWGVREYLLLPGDPTPMDFTMYHSDRSIPRITPL